MKSPMVNDYIDRLRREFDYIALSSCNGEYFLDTTDLVVTDGVTTTLSTKYKNNSITVVRGASFVIILDLNKDSKNNNDTPYIELCIDKSKLNYAVYDKIIKSKQNILENYQSIAEFIGERKNKR